MNEKRLSESVSFSLEKRRLRRNKKATFRSVKGCCKKERNNLFSISLLDSAKKE